ncbi:MAG: AAA family ATPase [Bacteroidales bacterium]|nr:AAA family ATPase [Bacteroidales bacterium]
MTTLKLTIEKLRSIKKLELELPMSPGLYAITGKNGSGKSTSMAAIANLFYNEILKNYFSNSTENGSLISYKFKDIEFTYNFDGRRWIESGRKIYLHGFYEGSLIHGNRFRDSHFKALMNAAKVKKTELIRANPEIKKNLGLILHDDESKYENLEKLSSDRAKEIFKFRSSPYFLVNEDRLISQLSLSTGENLLLSLLHSIYTQLNKRRDREDEYFILLDEVELALHPSALLRLLDFLETISKQHNMAIYFSTHSTDLIRKINPNNIFFLNKFHDNSVEVINPCFPAYATRNIYMHDGYDYLILVEDILTKKIVNWLLKKENLLSSKLIHILPCGGWEDVISLHQEIMKSNFLGAGKKAFTILDGDVEELFNKKYKNIGLHSNLNIAFLPIQSAEKFLRTKLFDEIDHKFFRHFNDCFFHKDPLDTLMDKYGKKYGETDKKGKVLLKWIEWELQKNKTTIEDFTSDIVEYIVENEKMEIIAERINKTFK